MVTKLCLSLLISICLMNYVSCQGLVMASPPTTLQIVWDQANRQFAGTTGEFPVNVIARGPVGAICPLSITLTLTGDQVITQFLDIKPITLNYEVFDVAHNTTVSLNPHPACLQQGNCVWPRNPSDINYQVAVGCASNVYQCIGFSYECRPATFTVAVPAN